MLSTHNDMEKTMIENLEKKSDMDLKWLYSTWSANLSNVHDMQAKADQLRQQALTLNEFPPHLEQLDFCLSELSTEIKLIMTDILSEQVCRKTARRLEIEKKRNGKTEEE